MKSSSSITLLTVAFLSLIFVSCSSNDAQKKFEEKALAEPSGYTKTDVQGKVQSKDEDDWRIGPMFQGYVDVETPAFPNPIHAGDKIEIQLSVTGIESVSGLEVYTRDENHKWRSIYYDQQNPLPTGLYVIRLDPISFTYTNNYQNAVGLHRAYIYDGNNNLITYGDIKIE